jgi:DUF1365 family protein
MRSHLLEGTVRHRRVRPFDYGLEHNVWYAALDLDELDELDARLRLFGRNRRALAVFRDRDHLPDPAADVLDGIRSELRAAGEDPEGLRITLITNPRSLGHVFNPASFFLCRDADERLRIVVVEVHNTYGERHVYILRSDAAAAGPDRFRAAMEKSFFVSPFIDRHGRYEVAISEDDGEVRIGIALRQDDQSLLGTSLVLHRRPLTDRWLLRMQVRHPLMTHRTIALIHWHAFRLWRRGAPFFRHGASSPAHGRAHRAAR